eukprot:m51a1_g4306 hypothetical protein (259) ;mRNA; r:24606-27039
MSRIRIGVSTSYTPDAKYGSGDYTASVSSRYLESLVDAGAIPVVFPPISDPTAARDLAQSPDLVDGWLFIGGPDYDPSIYSGHPQPQETIVEPRRQQWDLALAGAVLGSTDLPVLGVCAGCQLLAVVSGGALVQDIATEWGHEGTLQHSAAERPKASSFQYRHSVTLKPGSRLWRAVGSPESNSLEGVSSMHHQCVRPDRAGEGFEVVAWAPDGVPEAIEMTRVGNRSVGLKRCPVCQETIKEAISVVIGTSGSAASQ